MRDGDELTRVTEQEIIDPGSWRTALRQTKQFEERQKGIFLVELAMHGRIGEAARMAGVSRQTVLNHRKKDSEFDQACSDALEVWRDRVVGHHTDLCLNGTLKQTFDRNGRLISEERQYPIPLILAELRRVDPDYRDKQDVNVKHSGGVMVAPPQMTAEEWLKLQSEKEESDIPPMEKVIEHKPVEAEDG